MTNSSVYLLKTILEALLLPVGCFLKSGGQKLSARVSQCAHKYQGDWIMFEIEAGIFALDLFDDSDYCKNPIQDCCASPAPTKIL